MFSITKRRAFSLRILYLINHAGKAGSEKYVYNLVKAFNGKKAQCYFAYNEAGLLSEQMGELSIPSFQLEMRNPFDLRAAKRLAKICRENKIDVIHTQYPRENYIAILAKLFGSGARVVYTCHLTYYPAKIWYIMNRIIMPHNDRIIAVCNYGREILCTIGAPRKKIEVIFNGIPYPEDPVASTDIHEEFGLSEDTFVITTLSRCNPEKGLDFLVDSMKRLKEKTALPFVCLIAGDGPLLEDVKEKVRREGAQAYVFPLGFRSDTAKILSGSSVFVNSAKCNEALSFAILEAMGSALPIVATDIGGNPDIVQNEYGCGALVPYGDTEAMADALLKLMSDKEYYEGCRRASLARVREVFNLDKLLKQTYEQYTKE